MNLNFPFLPNLILQLHWVKHSPLSFKEDCEIELGKSREFFTHVKLNWVKGESFLLNTCEFKLSVFTQFNFTITLGKTPSAFIQRGL